MKIVQALLIAAFSLVLSACSTLEPTLLARDGVARMPVVVAPTATETLRDVAGDLAATLGEMTGGTFEVVEGDGSQGIVLGTPDQFPAADAAGALKVDGFDGIEACLIRTTPQRVLLLGATEQGAIHAAYRLLDGLGCRWFFPNDAWTVIPSRPNLVVAREDASRPALWSRRIWYGYGFFDRQQGRVQREYQQWQRRNRQGASLNVYCGHAWQAIIAAHQKTFDAHPEYLALVNGNRQGPQLCVSNPELRALVVQYAIDYFESRPTADMVSLDPADGGGQCECEPCAALGTISDRVFLLANTAAKALAEARPGKMVGLYAYNQHSEPPSFQLEPNVYIQLTRGFTRGRYTFDELRELWPRYCQSMGFYDYYSVYLWDWDMIPGGRGANVDYLAESIRSYAKAGATTLSCESGNNWGLHGRGYYLASRLMWNPDESAEAILNDFYNKAFGPAAPAMARYYERVDPGNQPLMSEHLIAMALRDLQEATELASQRPDVLARLDHLKQYMHYVCLRWQLQQSKDTARQKELALAVLTHVYRNRYTYMNHWEALRQTQTRRWAKQFEEPTWAFNEPTPDKPWAVDQPNTPAETDAQFKADLEAFQPEDITQLSFSDDLVLAAPDGPTAPLRLSFQGNGTYLLTSREGEPLEWTLTVGTIAHYRNRPAARYQLTREADGQEILSGKLELTGEAIPMSAKVPDAGRYRLQVSESSAGHRIDIPARTPSVLPLERGRRYLHAGHMPQLYLYVPAGTTELTYFIANSSRHILYGPDGEQVFEGEKSGVFYRVPVPEGLDGAIWSIRYLALGKLWFFNAPNYLASSPGTLMIPAELRDAK